MYGFVLPLVTGTWRGTPVAMKQILPERLNNSTLADFKKEVQILR
jgi:hypothetical protein